MRVLPLFSLLATLLLTSSAIAATIPYTDLETKARNNTSTTPVISNTTLTFIPPGGPPGFSCHVASTTQTVAFSPKDIFVTVIQMLESITQSDFNSRLPHPEMRFFGPGNLVIVISSVNPFLPMRRQFVMWAFNRILNTMEEEPHVGYHGGIFEPEWMGRKAGSIEIRFRRPNENLLDSEDSLTITSNSQGKPPQARNATAMVSNGELAWIFSPATTGETMTTRDIALGTIAALIEMAAHVSFQKFQDFTAHDVVESRAVCDYHASVLPPLLSKSVLIRTMAAAAVWALQDGDLHELRVEVLIDGKEVGNGGYREKYSGVEALSALMDSGAISSD